MNKKTKRGIILTSLASIAFAGSLLAGSTYALFTSESKTNIAVTSGTVDVSATVENLETYSGKDLTGNVETDESRIYKTNELEGGLNGTFIGGGKATYESGTLTLDKMEPGDKVKFTIKITNNSNVAAKYRTVVKKVNDTGLFNGLEVKVDNEDFLGASLISSYKSLGNKDDTFSVNVEVNLPSDRGNLYKDKQCNLSFAVEAVQGNAFDGVYEVTKNNIQEYLDGKHGSLDGVTLVLTDDAGSDYNKIEFGHATKIDTDYYVDSFESSNQKSLDEFLETKQSSTVNSYYVRNINNLTLKAEEGVDISVAGLSASGGHQNDNGQKTIYDYVLEEKTTGYYLAQNWNNVKFEGIKFTSGVEIASSIDKTSIDGVTFKNCKFINSGDRTNTRTNYGITYYNELANEKIKNLIVDSCEFYNCFHAIYCQQIKGVTLVNSSFDTIGNYTNEEQTDTGGNALQNNTLTPNGSSVENTVNEGAMIIKNNKFNNIRDRVLRFGNTGSDTQYVICGNKATDAGDLSKSVIKATKLADGITYDIHDNDWGTGTTINNSQFEDR